MGTGGKPKRGRVIDLPNQEASASADPDSLEPAGTGDARAELDRLAAYMRHGRVDARGLQLTVGAMRAELLRLGDGRDDAMGRLEEHLRDARGRAERMEALWARCQAGLAHLAGEDAGPPDRPLGKASRR